MIEVQPSMGESKINEYVSRIKNGESKEIILQGLPQSWIDKINGQLSPSHSESVSKEDRLRKLSERFDLPGVNTRGDIPPVSFEDRRKLSGWLASYELAKVARQQGIDLASLSREEYVDYAIRNSLAIDDTQLRMATWERMATSAEEVIALKKETIAKIKPEVEEAFRKFSYETITKAGEQDRFVFPNIRVRQGTGGSNSWLFFGINESTEEGSQETYKSYISFKDLNNFSPEKFNTLMLALRDAGYNGDIKTFHDMENQGALLNDQIVMHGRTEKDAKLALSVAEKLFGDELGQKGIGRDEVIDGKNKSYSEILAQKIASTIKKQ